MPHNAENKIQILAVVGPTASGKTALGVELARRFNGEIISADSMQIYKGMSIATAKPKEEEKRGIPHHLMDFLPVECSYSVAKFVDDAKVVIADIHSRGKLPIIVGGTGLYISSLLDNIEFTQSDDNEQLREQLYKKLENEGTQVLYDELMSFDSESAIRIGTGNAKRLIRAIEIYRTSGVTMTQQIKNSKLNGSPYSAYKIGLKCKDREKLYKRINLRVDMMLKDGLLDEAKDIINNNCSKTSSMAIGYKELIPYLNNECSLEDAVEKLKRETRRYAKRQLTWFRRDSEIHWFDTDTYNNIEALFDDASNLYKKYINEECNGIKRID